MKKSILLALILISSILLTACSQQLPIKETEKPELVAERFARFWEQKDFSNMYDMFIPELQARSDKDTFIGVMNFYEKSNQIVIRLDKVSMDNENTAYAYYTVSSSLFDAKAPAMKMVLVNGTWKIDAFAKYFDVKKEDILYIGKITLTYSAITTAMTEQTQLMQDILDLIQQRSFGDYRRDSDDVCNEYPEKDNFVTKFKIIQTGFSTIMPPEKFREHYTHLNNSINLQTKSAELTYSTSCQGGGAKDAEQSQKYHTEAKAELDKSTEILKQLGF